LVAQLALFQIALFAQDLLALIAQIPTFYKVGPVSHTAQQVMLTWELVTPHAQLVITLQFTTL